MLPQFRLRRTFAALIAMAVVAALTLTASGSTAQTALASQNGNPITPGNFRGYGFDACEAPSQAAMTAWLKNSPFRAIGIYMSGALRYCSDQPNLTPTWVRTQLATGWRLLPIHLGVQASCSSVPRYQTHRISADPANGYATARTQGRTEANVAAAAAANLGLAPSSTIFYDLEAFNSGITSCRESALKFLSAWTNGIVAHGYNSGVYSSAASGIKILDDARVMPGNTISLPYEIWIGDYSTPWSPAVGTGSTYFRPDGWAGKRIRQYQGGHDERYGGVTINIDRDYLDISGAPYTAPGPATPELAANITDPKCTTAAINHTAYRYTDPQTRPGMFATLQCVLKEQGLYGAAVTGHWNPRTTAGVMAWQKRVGHRQQRAFTQRDWISILVGGNTGGFLTLGAHGADVIRVQRAMNAAASPMLRISGVYNSATAAAVGAYQRSRGLKPTRTVGRPTWLQLQAGRQ